MPADPRNISLNLLWLSRWVFGRSAICGEGSLLFHIFSFSVVSIFHCESVESQRLRNNSVKLPRLINATWCFYRCSNHVGVFFFPTSLRGVTSLFTSINTHETFMRWEESAGRNIHYTVFCYVYWCMYMRTHTVWSSSFYQCDVLLGYYIYNSRDRIKKNINQLIQALQIVHK